MTHERARLVLDGPLDAQVERAVRELAQRGALQPTTRPAGARGDSGLAATLPGGDAHGDRAGASRLVVAVLAEDGRPDVTAELTAAAAGLARVVGGRVHVLSTGGIPAPELGAAGADLVVALEGSSLAEDVAAGVAAYVRETRPWALLAPSTAFGREVAGRVAAATGSGLTGDAMGLSVREGVLVAAKPAFAGALVADITSDSPTQMATVRPGVLPAPRAMEGAPASEAPRVVQRLTRRGRVRLLSEQRDDDVETLARAEVVIGVGTGVAPGEYAQLSPLAAVLGAELAATRKVTDRGWAPRSRQVGLTGRSIAPRLYVALGLSGKFNHMVGVRAAGTILAVNGDRDAPVFGHCDVGIVGDWHEAVPLLCEALRRRAQTPAGAPVS
jgi:electron transfer flavoprotein alpha subunit